MFISCTALNLFLGKKWNDGAKLGLRHTKSQLTLFPNQWNRLIEICDWQGFAGWTVQPRYIGSLHV